MEGQKNSTFKKLEAGSNPGYAECLLYMFEQITQNSIFLSFLEFLGQLCHRVVFRISNNIVKYLMNIRYSISGSYYYLRASLVAQM